ncbi:RING-box protein 2 [Vespula maculifrons]|uniref:RING-box protein 2 n=1 Tax=Vespula maculifrons TaxID=7453 RepID=A0ABD2BVE4_VESMC
MSAPNNNGNDNNDNEDEAKTTLIGPIVSSALGGTSGVSPAGIPWWGNVDDTGCKDVDACLRCQAESKKDFYGRQDCVVVWGECNHSFHYCCMSLWVKQNNRCPLCQQEWSIQRMGK